jgi:hypothetical protein
METITATSGSPKAQHYVSLCRISSKRLFTQRRGL